jgi:hypothetical protein
MIAGPLAAISHGDQAAVTATEEHRSCQLSGPDSCAPSTFQAGHAVHPLARSGRGDLCSVSRGPLSISGRCAWRRPGSAVHRCRCAPGDVKGRPRAGEGHRACRWQRPHPVTPIQVLPACAEAARVQDQAGWYGPGWLWQGGYIRGLLAIGELHAYMQGLIVWQALKGGPRGGGTGP